MLQEKHLLFDIWNHFAVFAIESSTKARLLDNPVPSTITVAAARDEAGERMN